MNVRLSRGRWSASLGSVCLAPVSLVLIGVVLLTAGLAGCGGSKPQAAAPVPALSISTPSLASGQVGAAYTASLSATGGTAPYQWYLRSGSLPAGLTFSASSGAIAGTPAASVSATPLLFAVTDSSTPAKTASASLSLTIAPPPLQISTASLASGQVGSPYSAGLAVIGGTPPYTWAMTSGSLPAGLVLNGATGAIAGTPTAAVTASPITFTATDSSTPVLTKSVTLSLTIAPPPPLVITTASLANAQVQAAYSTNLAATGGIPPYTWSVTSGSLPTGLGLTASTGVIGGMPTTAGKAQVTFTATDSGTPAQTQSVSLTLTISLPPFVISTTTLPDGQMSTAYSASLAASGGIPPYSWSLTSGSLPAGMTLNASTGAISGTPTAFVYNSPVTFTATDSSTPALNQSVTLQLTIASGITASITPLWGGLTPGQSMTLTPTVSDSAGVTWSVTGSPSCTGTACGTLSATKSLSGAAVTYTAPSTAGVYTITATSVTDKMVSGSATVGVTDLSGVATYHENAARTGANTQEYALAPSNVSSSTFGKLFSCPVDGAIYAQPLWVPGLTIGATKHNVVFVATQHDSLFAFDADASPCSTLWQVSLIDAAHGGLPGETPVPGTYVGLGVQNIMPEIGVTGTPMIDLTTNALYVVSKSVITGKLTNTFYQRLHAIDLTTGAERFSGPTTIAGTYPGKGDGGETTTFVAQEENQRAGLVLANGIVYIAWASHEDNPPYYGWVMGYNAGDLSQPPMVFNDSPNAGLSGIWMSGGAPAVDSAGNLYMATGNGVFDATNTTGPTNDYGDSLLELSPNLQVQQYFTPSDQLIDYNGDGDFGSGGAVVLVDLPPNGSNPTHLLLAGGKDGSLYVLNRDQLGGYGDSNAWQEIALPNPIFSTGAFWNSTYYIATIGRPMQAYSLSASTAKFGLMPNASASTFGFGGGAIQGSAIPTVSSMPDNSNGIVWALDNTTYCNPYSHGCGPTVLHALDASNLANELWNSSQGTGNAAGNAVKFTLPTVANGKVYVGTRGNNTGGADSTTSTPGELDVYGLLPN